MASHSWTILLKQWLVGSLIPANDQQRHLTYAKGHERVVEGPRAAEVIAMAYYVSQTVAWRVMKKNDVASRKDQQGGRVMLPRGSTRSSAGIGGLRAG